MTAQLLADARRVLLSCTGSRLSTVQQAAQQVAHRLLELKARRRCERCWLASAQCVCSSLLAAAPLRHVRRIFTVVPPHELGNPASSIKLLHLAYPDNARWAVAGLPGKAWDELAEAMAGEAALVLFPSAEAEPLLRAARAAREAVRGVGLVSVDHVVH